MKERFVFLHWPLRTLELLQQLNYEFNEAEREQERSWPLRVDNIYYNADDLHQNVHCIT